MTQVKLKLDTAMRLVEIFEGFRSRPYVCPAGVVTIGLGTTAYENGVKVSMSDAPITLERARQLALVDLTAAANAALRMAPVLQTSERRLNAIADFIFNLGAGRFQTSTLRRCINAQDWTGAVEQLNKWIRGGGKVLPGLVARRAAESQLIR